MIIISVGKGDDTHSQAQIDAKNTDSGEGGNENPANVGESYPASQTPPLGYNNKPNGNSNNLITPPPAPSIPPPPLDDEQPYTNGHSRRVKDSPV